MSYHSLSLMLTWQQKIHFESWYFQVKNKFRYQNIIKNIGRYLLLTWHAYRILTDRLRFKNSNLEYFLPSSVPDAHMVTENSPSSVLIDTLFCCHVVSLSISAPTAEWNSDSRPFLWLKCEFLFFLFGITAPREQPKGDSTESGCTDFGIELIFMLDAAWWWTILGLWLVVLPGSFLIKSTAARSGTEVGT